MTLDFQGNEAASWLCIACSRTLGAHNPVIALVVPQQAAGKTTDRTTA
ncbi:MAG: hypothetical protein AAGH40_01585 [Verrucomicrobiota bacterium]